MQSFKKFILVAPDIIIGGDHQRTYVGKNGDIYDTETGNYVFFL